MSLDTRAGTETLPRPTARIDDGAVNAARVMVEVFSLATYATDAGRVLNGVLDGLVSLVDHDAAGICVVDRSGERVSNSLARGCLNPAPVQLRAPFEECGPVGQVLAGDGVVSLRHEPGVCEGRPAALRQRAQAGARGNGRPVTQRRPGAVRLRHRGSARVIARSRRRLLRVHVSAGRPLGRRDCRCRRQGGCRGHDGGGAARLHLLTDGARAGGTRRHAAGQRVLPPVGGGGALRHPLLHGALRARTTPPLRQRRPCAAGADSRQRRGGAVHRGGVPLGLFESPRYFEGHTAFESGDVLVLYTDGIVEQTNREGEEYGRARLIETIRDTSDSSATELCSRVMQQVHRFGDGAQVDDRTLVVIKSTAPAEHDPLPS